MEQIQQHEWETFFAVSKCKHCECRKGEVNNTPFYYYWDIESEEDFISEEPACITRTPECVHNFGLANICELCGKDGGFIYLPKKTFP